MNKDETIKVQQELINLLMSQVADLSMMSKIELGDDVIAELKRLKGLLNENGFYNFWFTNDDKGYWTSHSLRLIANKLDELNKEWNDYILKNLK